MSQLDSEQIAVQGKAYASAAFELSTRLLDALAKLSELNLQAAKSGLAEGRETVEKALSATTPGELLSLNAGLVYPALQKSFAYTRHVFAIASDARGEFEKMIDAQYRRMSDDVDAFVDNARGTVPPGAEASIAALKSVIDATNKAYDTVREAGHQASKVLEDNLAAAAEAVTHAGQQAGATVPATVSE